MPSLITTTPSPSLPLSSNDINANTTTNLGIVEYLVGLGTQVLETLYKDPSTISTVFRSLPPLARQYLLRLSLLPPSSPLPLSLLHKWRKASPLALQLHSLSLERLLQLRIVSLSEEDGNTDTDTDQLVHVNTFFRESLLSVLKQDHMTTTIQNTSSGSNANTNTNTPSTEEVEQHSSEQWNSLLLEMVQSSPSKGRGRGRGKSKTNNPMLSLLSSLSLVQIDPHTKERTITEKGYKFLFSSLHSQLWTILIGYLNLNTNTSSNSNTNSNALEKSQVLRFMFSLGFLRLGHTYSKKQLTPSQKVVVQDLCQLGILYHSSPTSSRYYPTPLSLSLSSQSSHKTAHTSSQSTPSTQIIVETTFKIYAYTTSPLQQTLLRLFLHIQFILPNLVVGKLTKQSVKRALSYGIGAQDIVQYLGNHSHGRGDIPPNVVDQLGIWEEEGKRLRVDRAALISHFSCIEEYQACLEYTRGLGKGVLLFVDEDKKELYVTREGLQRIKASIREWRP